MVFSVKFFWLLFYVYFVLGILVMVVGIVFMKVIDYYSGLFGMGIWFGVWVCVEFK